MPKVHYRIAAQRRLRRAAGDAFCLCPANPFVASTPERVQRSIAVPRRGRTASATAKGSRPKVPVDYSLVDGLSLVAGFQTSWSLCARAGLVTLRQTFVRRCHGGWTASEPPHFSRNGTPPRDENRRCIPSNENWLR